MAYEAKGELDQAILDYNRAWRDNRSGAQLAIYGVWMKQGKTSEAFEACSDMLLGKRIRKGLVQAIAQYHHGSVELGSNNPGLRVRVKLP